MLDDGIKAQLAAYFERITQPVALIASLDDSEGAQQIRELVTEVAAVAPDKITARFDGTDRWLQRSFVVADLAASAGDRDGRIITTEFATAT